MEASKTKVHLWAPQRRRTVSAMATEMELVTEAIRGADLCTMCIARKVGAAPLSIISTLAPLGQRMTITEAVTRCSGCRSVRSTHRI